MTSGKSWWALSTGIQEPEARWLGVFRRTLPLKPSVPSLLSIPTVKLLIPQCLSCEISTSPAGVLTTEESLSPTQITPIGDIALSTTGGGSVALTGVLVDDNSPSGLSVEDTTEGRRPRRLEPGGLDTGLSDAEVSLARRLAYLLQAPADLLASCAGPLEWPGTLFPYQMEGVQELMSRDALLLADDMGLGKTIQVVAALRILAIQRRIEAVLVVVRASLLAQWRKEIRTWAPELRTSTIHGPAAERAYQWSAPAHVYLVTYETLRSDFTQNPASPPRRRTWDAVILDEAQQIKNPKADISQKCKLLPRKRAWALTGTPLENSLDDLASILEFVTPLAEGETPVRLRPDEAMLKRHRQLQLRRKKADVLEQLPPKTTNRLLLPLPESQSESYRMAEKQGVLQLRGMGEAVRIENVLELILRLKQICNFCPRTGQSGKLEDIRERIGTLVSEGHRALVFSQFVDPQFGVKAVASGLKDFCPLSYTGSLASVQRESTIRAFKGDPSHKVLVLSLRAGGYGLNLQEASYVFHFDRWWNPSVEHQAEDRVHRIGQSSPVHVYKYICEGTIEERIDHILQEKQLLFDEIVDDVSLDLKARLTAEELFGLFGLTPPTGSGTRDKRSGAVPDYSQMSGVEFEQHVKSLLERRGWTVETTPKTRDGGIDLKASRAVDMGGDFVLYVQCKNYQSPVGVEVVRQLNGVLPKHQPGSCGVVVCPSGFSGDARYFGKDRGIILWERQHLFELGSSAANSIDTSHSRSQHDSPDGLTDTTKEETEGVPAQHIALEDDLSVEDTVENRLWHGLKLGGMGQVTQGPTPSQSELGLSADSPDEAPESTNDSLPRSELQRGIHRVKSGILSLPLSWIDANGRPSRLRLKFHGDRLVITTDENCPDWRGVRYAVGTATISLPRRWLGDAQKVAVVPVGKNLEVTKLAD
jgi:hypothetical protein